MKKTILVIDDSAPIRYLLEAMLSKEYSVVSAADGFLALAWLSNGNSVDCIVTDLQMPNISGWELLDHLSSSVLYRDIPVVVLSGNVETDATELTNKYSNVFAFTRKPFDPVQLMKTVGEIVGRRVAAAV
ncbi:Response regulator receiver domain-containing protein [Chitinophaga terrae (ex Kim and Jung 2007)]|uniref:Response regulator receiver domain-containing protein n=1 Tax=Chitinophaga terrae (ex Kim and Jung 2007) TaxID=408074 RepID=A0A1H4CD34_9BACT|nr:response regulator [Chitinophaga terrae (ex Kim and Jung 2007)]GEP88887.1 response regulator [Chitinophaga terrae (ex Kim and Jung 2007)]SEA58002.1 Response regulator receiver domain-containing protein [Chitinophaga terrae (ex Kim and Jung 2007)]